MSRKCLFGSFARNLCILRSLGRGPSVACRPGGVGLRQGCPKKPARLFGTPLWAARGTLKGPPYHRDSLLWESFGVPWGVWGGGSRAVRGAPLFASGSSGCNLNCVFGFRLASAGFRGCCWEGLLRVPGVRVRSSRRHQTNTEGQVWAPLFVLLLFVWSFSRYVYPCLRPFGVLPICSSLSFSAAMSRVFAKLYKSTCFPFPNFSSFLTGL